MPSYEIEVPGKGKYRVDSPVDLTDVQAWQAVQGQLDAPPSTDRTWGEAVTDVGASLLSGAGSLVQLPGQLYGLATGDMDVASIEMGKKMQEKAEGMKSAGLKAQEAARAQKIAEAEKNGQLGAAYTAFTETITNPALLVSFLAEQAPQLLVPFGAAKVGRAALAAKGLEAAGKAGARAAIGAGAIQQGADVGAGAYEDIYQELKSNGASDQDAAAGAINLARAAGASGALISLLAQRLPGASKMEEAFAGVPGKGGRLARAATTGLGEAGGEVVEETGGQFSRNLAMRDVNPEQSLTEGLGQSAGLAAIGGLGMGAATGLATRSRPAEAPAVEEKPVAEEKPELATLPDVNKPVIAPAGVESILGRPSGADVVDAANLARLNALNEELKKINADIKAINVTKFSDDPVIDAIRRDQRLKELNEAKSAVRSRIASKFPDYTPEEGVATVTESPIAPSLDNRGAYSLPTGDVPVESETPVELQGEQDVVKTTQKPVGKSITDTPIGEVLSRPNDLPIGGTLTSQPEPIEAPAATPAPEIPSTQPPASPAPAAADSEVEWDEDYDKNLPKESNIVFQNRNRSQPGSVQQMQSIASNPDYSRLSVSRDFGSGAPVVISGRKLDATQFGKTAYATTSDGQRIPVKYAVVERADLMPSNSADGRPNAEFEADIENQLLRPIAGNGRVAGLSAAYDKGTAAQYRSEMLKDAEHGINPAVIESMRNPILVRVMPKSRVTPNLVDLSNVSGVLELTPVEQAKNDARRIDLNGLSFNDDGQPSKASLSQFAASMPMSERGGLIDSNGQPNARAVERLSNAIFWKAYENEGLISLYADAADPDSKRVISSLAAAAPKMARLSGAGEYDVRPVVAQAAESAVNAARRGIKIADAAKQVEMGVDANVVPVLEMFAENYRSGKKMAEALNRLADAAYEQSQSGGQDLLGQVPQVPVADLFKKLKPETEPDLFGGEQPTAPTQPETPVETPVEPPAPVEPKAPEEPVATPETTAPPAVAPEEVTYAIDKSEEQIAQEIHGLTTVELASWLVKNAPNKAAKEIASKVYDRAEQYAKKRVFRETVKVLNNTRRLTSGTRARQHTKWLPGGGLELSIDFNGLDNGVADRLTGTKYGTALHEMIHAVTTVDIHFNPNSKQAQELRQILNLVKREVKKDIDAGKTRKDSPEYDPIIAKISTGSNALQNIKELIAWGLTDAGFQRYLMKIDTGNNQTAWGKFVSVLREIFNVSPKYESALDAVARITEEIIDRPMAELEANTAAAGVPFKGMPLPLGGGRRRRSPSVESNVNEENVGEKLKDIGREVGQKRPMPEKGMEHLPPEMVAEIQPKFYPKNTTFVDKVEAMKDDFWKRLAQGVVDQYRSIKDYSMDAYMKARMSTTIDGALEGLLFYGQVWNNGGALAIKEKTKGMVEILQPLGKEVDAFMIWMALNREARLPEEKRTPEFANLVSKRGEMVKGKIGDKSRLEVYEKARDELNKLNKSVLTVARDAGLIDEDGYDKFSSDIYYVPFYRLKDVENGDLAGAQTASQLGGQYFSKELKGKADKPFGDLMENMVRNWSHLLSASMKNQAANATMEAAIDAGAATANLKPQYELVDGLLYNVKTGKLVGDGTVMAKHTQSQGSNFYYVQDGNKFYVSVSDPMLMESVAAITRVQNNLKILSKTKNLLQFGVTISPAFKVRNLIRDSISSIAVSGLSKNPAKNVIEGWNLTDRKNPYFINALAGGAVFNFGSTYEGDQAKLVKDLVRDGVDAAHIWDSDEKIISGMKMLWRKYNDFGNKSESANRMALYKQLRDQNMTHLEASYYAKDLLDFSMHGAFGAVRFLTQTVPFMNARLQGLYKLGRDGVIPTSRVIYNSITGQPIDASDAKKAQAFGSVAFATALASAAMFLAFKDDEDYKRREDWDRDNFWWFKLPGMDFAVRIPKPFEVGMIGTLTERTLDQMFNENVEGAEFTGALSRMLWDTFAMNPMPQAFKPLADIYANKDSFTGAPIESAGMELMSKAERKRASTTIVGTGGSSLVNVFLPESMEISPVQMEYLVRGYLGWLGGMSMDVARFATQPFNDGEYPDISVTQYFSAGFLKELPQNQVRYVTSFYKHSQEINQAMADMRHYVAIGQMDKAREIATEQGDKRKLYKLYQATSRSIANVRNRINQITADKNIDGATKKQQIDRMRQLIAMLAERAEITRIRMQQQSD